MVSLQPAVKAGIKAQMEHMAGKIYTDQSSTAGVEEFSPLFIETVIRPEVLSYAHKRLAGWDKPQALKIATSIVEDVFNPDGNARTFDTKEKLERLISVESQSAESARGMALTAMMRRAAVSEARENDFTVDNPWLRRALLDNFETLRAQASQHGSSDKALRAIALENPNGQFWRAVMDAHRFNISRMLVDMNKAYETSLVSWMKIPVNRQALDLAASETLTLYR